MPAGRPPKYKKEFVKQAMKLCELAATDEDLAEFFEVNVDTIYDWKKKHREFSDAIAAAKLNADARVEKALYQRAIGYERKAVKIFQRNPKQALLNKLVGGGESDDEDEDLPRKLEPLKPEEEALIVPYIEYIPPEVTACRIWLYNRNPKKWRDKIEISGEGGGPLVAVIRDVGSDEKK